MIINRDNPNNSTDVLTIRSTNTDQHLTGGVVKTVVVTGAGGFIGGHLTRRLVTEGHDVVAIDGKPLTNWYQVSSGAKNYSADAGDSDLMERLFQGASEIYHLAADMGGMGFIELNKLDCMLTVETSVGALKAASTVGVDRFFFASSACVYAAQYQQSEAATPLAEHMAYPAMPEDGYGWEKLFTERLCRHFREDRSLATRVGRYHNVYGPHGTWRGGREKAPAAVCRKIAEAVLSGNHEIEIWGDGNQTRSFMYVDDCVEGTIRLLRSNFVDPLNIGTEELVTINQLVSIVEQIAGIEVHRRYNLEAPQGVRGRNSDNRLLREILEWEPSIPLLDGLEQTYAWVYKQMIEDTGPR